MQEHDVLVFLLSLAVLLSAARVLGELARRLGFPLVFGELASGILLGPTVFGRLAPGSQHWLFPGGTAAHMLAGYTNVAVVLLLVVAGLEVNLGIVQKRGRSALLTSVMGIAMPLAGGFVLGMVLPDSDLVRPDHRALFALFMGVALSISALPVIAKTLLDLGLFKTDVGLLVMAAAMIDDLVGWLAFSVLLGPMQGGTVDARSIGRAVALTLGFVMVAFLVGRPLVGRMIVALQSDLHAGPRRVLSLIVLLALFGASFTQWAGIHAVFGGFVVGVVVGDARHLKERTKVIVHDFVTNIFAPVFFASLGLRADFVRSFDLRLCALVFLIASGAKIIGCTLGSRAGGLRWRPAAAVGFGLNARGAMEIILALLALEAGLLKEQLFVALVVMALLTSLISGPTMKWMLRGVDEETLTVLLTRGAWVRRLAATTASAAIEELIEALGRPLGGLEARAARAVRDREAVAPTGLGDEVAIPHAVVPGLERPVLALGASADGIDFNAPDERPAKLIFLLLMPPRAHDQEVRILAQIARAAIEPASRAKLLEAATLAEVFAHFSRTRQPMPGRSTRRVSLADI
ncbi:MAG TPA: cation:proton antiporter [Polyangiaceae bacterium]|jgi:Kef-type K+ transport system membrane component KefB/mannitol/fructose-specific phosphotransferase system IIA component (Ntr-type)|nr:cation:proton antiporter [Polyangiaceae bacterium]